METWLDREVVVHVHTVSQSARIISVQPVRRQQPAATGHHSAPRVYRCRFQFLHQREFVLPGATLLIRDGNEYVLGRGGPRCVGTIVAVGNRELPSGEMLPCEQSHVRM